MNPHWRDDAACRRHNPELWYPNHAPGRSKADPYAEARAICAQCPVVVDCLEHVLTIREDHGLWAGLDPDQRARLYRERPPVTRDAQALGLVPAEKHYTSTAACGTPAGYQRHRWRGETTCPDCREAVNDYNRARRAHGRTA